VISLHFPLVLTPILHDWSRLLLRNFVIIMMMEASPSGGSENNHVPSERNEARYARFISKFSPGHFYIPWGLFA
jgi:hypothetical protein